MFKTILIHVNPCLTNLKLKEARWCFFPQGSQWVVVWLETHTHGPPSGTDSFLPFCPLVCALRSQACTVPRGTSWFLAFTTDSM